MVDKNSKQYLPVDYLIKKKIIKKTDELQSSGYVQTPLDNFDEESFKKWFESQFQKM